MPTKFTIFIPPTVQQSIDNDQLSTEIKNKLSDRLSNFKYKANFPIDISVLEQGWISTTFQTQSWHVYWVNAFVDKEDGHKEASIGHYFIYIDQADKIDLKIGSERSSFLKVNDITSSKYWQLSIQGILFTPNS